MFGRWQLFLCIFMVNTTALVHCYPSERRDKRTILFANPLGGFFFWFFLKRRCCTFLVFLSLLHLSIGASQFFSLAYFSVHVSEIIVRSSFSRPLEMQQQRTSTKNKKKHARTHAKGLMFVTSRTIHLSFLLAVLLSSHLWAAGLFLRGT